MRGPAHTFLLLIFTIAGASPNLLAQGAGPVNLLTPLGQAGATASKRSVPGVGYIGRQGKVVIEPRFQDAESFSEGLAAAKSGGLWGYIDKTGNWVIKPRFLQAKPFSEGLAAVNIHGAWGFVDKQGVLVIPARFDAVDSFSDDRALVEIDYRWEYLDRSGNAAFKQTFPKARDFSEGLAAACSDQTSQWPPRIQNSWIETGCAWGYINPSGQFVITPGFDDALDFSEDLAAVRAGLKWGYIDRTGKVVIKPRFDEAGRFSDGLANVSVGKISGAYVLQEGTAFVRCGYIDRRGHWAFSSHVLNNYPGNFSDGLAMVRGNFSHNEIGYVDKTGKIIVKPQYTLASEFADGLALVGTPGSCGYIDHTGTMVVKLKSACGGPFSEGMAVYPWITGGAAPTADRQAEDRWLQKGERLLRQHRYQNANAAFGEASLYHEGNCPECLLGQARAWAGIWQYGVALRVCDSFFAANPRTPALVARGHGLKGEWLVEEAKAGDVKKLAQAENELRLALKMDPTLSAPRYYLGLALLKEGQETAGLQELRSYIDHNPDDDRGDDARRFLASPGLVRQNYAPSFSITTLQGQHLSLDSLRGKVVLLDFWATWCPPCRAELPQIARLAHKFPPDQFVLISLSGDTNEQAWRTFVRDHKMDWPQFFDPRGTLDGPFHVLSIPALVLIDQQGIVRYDGSGWQLEYVESEIRRLLNRH